MPVAVPAGVTVEIAAGNVVTVKGPNGTLSRELHKDMIVKYENGEVTVSRPSDVKEHRSLHGLTRTLIANMVEGVSNGYSKTLEIEGVGYRAAKQGKDLVMNLGYSHQVIMSEGNGITIEVPQPNKIIISGIDKQAVGQFAAEVREKRPPEPYKGKGIRYTGEYIIRKEGKAGKGKK
jgi:large subunit ribosomal protein L6